MTMTASPVLQVHPADNVIVVLRDLRAGEEVALAAEVYCLPADVPAYYG
jgi:hypothetical protein